MMCMARRGKGRKEEEKLAGVEFNDFLNIERLLELLRRGHRHDLDAQAPRIDFEPGGGHALLGCRDHRGKERRCSSTRMCLDDVSRGDHVGRNIRAVLVDEEETVRGKL